VYFVDIIVFFQHKASTHGFYITSPIAMRFSSPSNAYISPQYGKVTCMIEVSVLQGCVGGLEVLSHLRRFLFEKYNARQHYGMINDVTYEQLEANFPDTFKKFLRTYAMFNSSKVFSNSFTNRLGLDNR